MSIETYEQLSFDTPESITNEHVHRDYKILLISHNSLDIFLVNKLLNEIGNFKVYEAGNLKAAMKIVSYIELDLIFIDDTLPSISTYEILTRLERNMMLKNVPKLVLLTQDYQKTNYNQIALDNIDFIKKPIDHMIFKTRVHSILKNREVHFQMGSVFENMIDTKINEAKEFLKIYQSFLDIDQNLLCVYDKQNNQIVESNKHFIKFFGEHSLTNRVLSNPRLMKRFISQQRDPNYLNAHPVDTWIDLITGAKEFNFLITLHNRGKDFTFSVSVNPMLLFKKEMYVIKLSNHNIYISNAARVKSGDMKAIDTALFALHETIESLETIPQKSALKNGMRLLLDTLQFEDRYFQTDKEIKEEINVYFVIASLFKRDLNMIRSTLNDVPIDETFDENRSQILARIDADALYEGVRGIVESYHDIQNLHADIKLFSKEGELKIEIITFYKEDSTNQPGLVEKLLGKDQSAQSSYDTMPKNVDLALTSMGAEIKSYFSSGQNIFMITIPIS